MTPAEVALWQELRRSQLGVRFRRQQPLGPLIVDFVCLAAGLVIELDGQPHFDDFTDYEERRTQALEGLGYRVMRFENRFVYEDLAAALELIREAIGLE